MLRILPALVAGVFLLLAGCDAGPRMYSVKGRVKLNGVPIETGLVRFESADGNRPSAKGGVIANGEYDAQVPAGELIVRITGSKIVGTRQVYDTPDSPVKNRYEQFVPRQFNDESTLKVTIQADREDLHFDLKSE